MECGTGKINPALNLFGAQAVNYEHGTQIHELVTSIRTVWLRSPGMSAYITLKLNACDGCGDRLVTCFKQALRLPVVVAKSRDIASINEVRYIDVRTNLNPWVAMQGLTKNPIGTAIEEGRRECISLLNAEANLNRQ